jgi:cytochrome P450
MAKAKLSEASRELSDRIAGFDIFDPDLQEDPFPFYNEIREQCPLGRAETYGGYWIVSRYEDVEEVLRDSSTYSSRQVLIPHFEHFYGEQIPLELDPPEHTKFRQALSPLFGPPRVSRIEPLIRETARRLAADIAGQPEVEFIEAMAIPLPSETFLHSFGIPRDRLGDLLAFKDRVIKSGLHDDDPEYEHKRAQVLEFFTELLDKRKAEGAIGDDVISELLRSKVDERPWTDEEILNAAIVLLLASLDTTTSAFSLIITRLAEQRELRERLVRDPAIIPTAIEEFLRWEPLLHNGRVLRRDVEKYGTTMKAGDRIMCLFGGAHRDPRVYEDPDRLDFDREATRHMAFGAGPHRCLGLHLARATMRIGLEELHKAVPVYSVKPRTRPVRRETYVRGVSELYLSIG